MHTCPQNTIDFLAQKITNKNCIQYLQAKLSTLFGLAERISSVCPIFFYNNERSSKNFYQRHVYEPVDDKTLF